MSTSIFQFLYFSCLGLVARPPPTHIPIPLLPRSFYFHSLPPGHTLHWLFPWRNLLSPPPPPEFFSALSGYSLHSWHSAYRLWEKFLSYRHNCSLIHRHSAMKFVFAGLTNLKFNNFVLIHY